MCPLLVFDLLNVVYCNILSKLYMECVTSSIANVLTVPESSIVVFVGLFQKSTLSPAPCPFSLLFSALQVKKQNCKIIFCDLQP